MRLLSDKYGAAGVNDRKKSPVFGKTVENIFFLTFSRKKRIFSADHTCTTVDRSNLLLNIRFYEALLAYMLFYIYIINVSVASLFQFMKVSIERKKKFNREMKQAGHKDCFT